MDEIEETADRAPEPGPVIVEAEAEKRVERQQDRGGAIDVDAAHDRSS